MPRLWAKNEVTKMKQIGKRLFAMLLTLALIASTLTVAAAEVVYGVCTDDNVNVRKQGSSGAKIWFKVDEGHVAQIIGTVEEDGVIVWYKINTAHPVPNGHTYIGYISADYFRPMTQQETDAYLADNDLLPPVVEPEEEPTQPSEPTEEPTLRPSTDDALNGSTGYEGVEVVGAKGKTLGGTNFRDLPSTKTGKIIGTIPGKTVIDILAVPANGGEWYCVSYNGKVGFVHQGMVTLMDAGATVTPTIAPPVVDDGHTEYKGTEVVGAKGKTLGGTKCRSEPSTTTGKVITSIPAGTEIDINGLPLEGAEDPWYRIRYQDRPGYVHANMVKLTNAGTVPTPDPGFGTEVTDTWGEITADDVRFRYGPSTEAAVIRKFAEGTEVEVLTVPDEIGTKYWYRVRHNGEVGYVQSNYVRITKAPETPAPILPPEDEEDTDVVNSTGEITADGVNFRVSPTTESASMGKLNRGTVVELLTIPAQVDGNHWYKVRYNGLNGYIQAPFVRVLTLDPGYLPAPEKYGYAKLTENSANLRLEPAGSTVLTWKGKGSLLPIVGASELKSGFQWYPVHYTANSTIYYVREDMIQVVLLQNGEQVTPTPEPESEFGYVITTTYGVNLRLKANGDEVITQIPRNTILTCVAEAVKPTGSQYWWYCVKYNGMIGYVRGDCVRVCSSYGGPVSATPTPKPTEMPDTETVRGYIRLIKTDVALRVFPLQAVQTRLPKGLILPVVGNVVPADTYGQYCWYYVRTADGKYGYIRGDCAVSCYPEGDEIPNTPTPKPGTGADLVGATGKMLKNTNFREKPSSASSSAIMTVIKAGTIVEVLSIPEDTKYGWYKIYYNGKTGYVYGTLIEMVTYGTESDGPQTEKPSAFGYVMITDANVNLRDAVDGLTLTQLNSYLSGVRRQQFTLDYEPGGSVQPLVLYGDTLYGKSTVNQVVDYAESLGYHVLAAVNSDYFFTGSGIPTGMTIQDGVLVTSDGSWNAVGILENGKAFADTPKLSLTLTTEDGEEYPIHALNNVRTAEGLYLYTDDFDYCTRTTAEGTEVVLQLGSRYNQLKIGKKVEATVSSIAQTKNTDIGENQMVLSLTANNKPGLDLYSMLEEGEKVTIRAATPDDRWEDVVWATGGGNILVRDGQLTADANVSGREPRTLLGVREDGSFSGLYSDSDMGDSGENYPHGTRYTCSFTGRFEVTSVTANTATLKLTALTYEQEKDTVWYEDGVRYIAAEAYGLAGHTEFVLYLPNTPTADLPEEAKRWQIGDIGAETIDCFALYCPAGGDTFFGG